MACRERRERAAVTSACCVTLAALVGRASTTYVLLAANESVALTQHRTGKRGTMGFFDKVKKFAGGKNTAKVEIVEINDGPLEDAMIQISDAVTTGKMRVTALQDCTMLAMKTDIILRTENDQG